VSDIEQFWKKMHDVRTEDDLKRISNSGGALEAFVEAKSSGRVRFIGVTGHHDPDILTRSVTDWSVDAVMMPVNPVEETHLTQIFEPYATQLAYYRGII
jgi:predicted aldo/keto reductase-like oxidoreductase